MKLFKVNPEIIGVHVPKTAGTTFKDVLKDSYGLKLHEVYKAQDLHLLNNGLEYKCNNPLAKVIYGHIQAHPKWKEQYPEAKLVTWVRDPVERVISLYYMWKEQNHTGRKFENFAKTNPDLIDFVKAEECHEIVHAYQTYLGKVKPSDFDFVGRTEYFEQDLQSLGNMLGRKFKYQGKSTNRNVKKPLVSEAVKNELQFLLNKEYELYESLKSKRA